jgi:hypothetical protein
VEEDDFQDEDGLRFALEEAEAEGDVQIEWTPPESGTVEGIFTWLPVTDIEWRPSGVTDPSDLKTALDAAEKELQEAYRKVWPLREAYAEVTPPAALPSRRSRTDKQALIARCPRCGTRLESEGAAPK